MRVLGEEPGLGLPNQHAKACPRFQTMRCWCPSATGPNQPHGSNCFQYKRPLTLTYKVGHKFGHSMPYKFKLSDMTLLAKAYAVEWIEATVPVECNGCTCDHRFTATGHATTCPAFCPLAEKADTLATVTILEPDAASAAKSRSIWRRHDGRIYRET